MPDRTAAILFCVNWLTFAEGWLFGHFLGWPYAAAFFAAFLLVMVGIRIGSRHHA